MIQFVVDSACDLPKEMSQEYGIEVLPLPIQVDGKEYHETIDFTNEEFYDMLKRAQAMPTHAQITALQYCEKLKEYAQKGVDEVVLITINSTGSGIYDAALLGKQMFYEESGRTPEDFPVYVVDSKTYTMAYGYPVVEAARMVQKGASAKQAVEYLEDYFARVEIYFAPYTLEYVKKSGRVSCAAAFVGEVLGLRPIISIIDGQTKIITKVRGDKNIVPKMLEIVKERKQGETPYFLVHGDIPAYGQQLSDLAEKEFGYGPVGDYSIGAAISINAGPTVVGMIVRGPKRR